MTTHPLKVLSYNMANYDDWPNWETRRGLMADVIVEEDPDVLMLQIADFPHLIQEVRFNPDNESTRDTYQNMAEQLLSTLVDRGYFEDASINTLPIAYYPLETKVDAPRPSRNGKKGVEWEGLSVITKDFTNDTGALFMTMLAGGRDLNPRASQYSAVNYPQSLTLNYRVGFINTHLSYALDDALSNVKETLEWMDKQFPPGDLNVTPDEQPYQKLIESKKLIDVWTHLHGDEPGLTYPSNAPTKRIDYILASPKLASRAQSIKVVGKHSDNIYASDHLAVVATFDIPVYNTTAMSDVGEFHIV